MKKIIFLFSSLIFICACSNKKEAELNGTWRQYDINFADDNSSRVEFSEEAKLKRQLETPSIISFYKDDTFTELDGQGNYAYGQTNLISEGPTIDLKSKHQKLQYILEINKEGRQVLTLIDAKANIAKKYMKDCDNPEVIADDPFAPTNNTRRLKPKKKEDSLLIAKRLRDYIKHLALVLKSAKTNSSSVISFEFSKGPAKIYNGAIGVEPFDKVETEWLNCFYDEDDCRISYSIFDHVMTLKKKYRGAYSADWVEVDYNILLDIYSRFEGEPIKNPG